MRPFSWTLVTTSLGLLLLLAEASLAAPVEATWIRLFVSLCLLAVIALLLRRPAAGPLSRSQLLPLCLATLVGIALPWTLRAPNEQRWARQGEERLGHHYESVQRDVLDLETVARDLGDRAYALLTDSSRTPPMGAEKQVRLFEDLQALLPAASEGEQAGAAPSFSVRLLSADGDLLAWAGARHTGPGALRLSHFAPGPRETYFRRSGALTFFTYDRQDARIADVPADSVRGIRVLVETPVHARRGTRPRLPVGANWSERFSRSGIEADLYFDARLVPPYLTQKDLEIHGDPQRGLQAEFVVRGDDGAPRLLGRFTTPPLADDLLLEKERLHQGQRLFALVALALALGIGLQWWRRTPRRPFRRVAPFIAALWVLRGAAALFEIPPASLHGSPLLSPATFAVNGFGGLLRSPLDFLLTALTLGTTAFLLLHAQVQQLRQRPPSMEATGLWRAWSGVLLATGLVAATVLFIVAAVERLALNSSQPLLGPEFNWTALPSLCLHGALLAAVAAFLVLSLLVVSNLLSRRLSPWTVLVPAVLLALLLWIRLSPLLGLVSLGLLAGGFMLQPLLRDDRFTSFGLATFAIVALTATLCTVALQHDGMRTRQEHVLARADSVRQLVDDVRSFVLEHVLRDLTTNVPRQGDPALADNVVSFAFEIWAESMLSRMGWPCQVRLYTAYGSLLSEFSLGLPYPQDTQTREIQQRALGQGICIEQTEIEGTPVGNVRLVRGAVPLRLGRAAQFPVVAVIDLPFGHESLALAANPRVRAPELLRPLHDLDTGPRVEESQLYLLAWLQAGFVVESSSPYLEVGEPLGSGESILSGWRSLRLLNGTYRVTEIPAGERTLLAGFRLPNALDDLLDWTQVAALDFTIATALLLLFFLCGRVPRLARTLPPLFVPKRLGFQQKLMGAFLVVALLPSLVISLATRDIMRDRSTSRNRDAALAKARSAEAALSDVVRREIQAVRESEYLRGVIKEEEAPPVRDIGNLEFSQIMVFHGDGRLIIDETLSNLSDEEARRFVTDSPRQVFASRDAGYLNLGVLEPVWVGLEGRRLDEPPDMRLYYLYYRRRLTDDLLRELAPILNTDISGFLGPRLVVSSQKSLAAAGLLPTLVPPTAYQHVQLRDNHYAVLEERAASQRYFSGYLPLEDRFGRRIATLAVQQLLQPDEFAVEVERTRALVVGLSTTMFVLALILAVVFAARIFDPVRSLIEGTRRIAGGDLGFRLRARAGDEIGELERSFNEMTLRLQAARTALEERRRYLEAVLGNIASGVVATDVRGHITAANAAASRILGVSQEHLASRTWQTLAVEAKDTGTRSFWSHVGEAEQGDIMELSMRREDEPLTLRLIVTELRSIDHEAESLGRVAIFEDVTELIRSKKLAAWAEMARQVAHEIKNPLTPLKLSAQFMEQAYRDGSERFPEIFTEGMRTIVQQVDVLRRIASEFSGFGRIQKLQRKPLDLGDLLRRVTAPYRTMQGVVLDLGDSSPDFFPGDGVTVLGDDEGLRKVFSNILENAREAMGGEGRILLRVEPGGDGEVLVRVGDEGTGVSQEARERLFEPYFSTKTTGTGLGLAITRSILEEIGGSISLSNRPDGGAEVRITLPGH